MSPEKEQLAFVIYQEAMDLPESERAALVWDRTGGDEELLEEINSYLAHADTKHWASMEKVWFGKIEELVADAMASGDDTLPGNQLIGTYVIERKIGEGGMGRVYAAYDANLQRPAALKLLSPMAAADAMVSRRLLREARLLARLNHPNIVGLYGVEEWEGRVVLCLELVDGDTLDKHIPESGMDLDSFTAIAGQLADALCGAHKAGVIHRDLKPANILIDRSGQVKVTDFGLARGKNQAHKPKTETEVTITEKGTIMGSYPYMSPEQVKGEQTDTSTDFFSLGIVLFEMACGMRPFKGVNRAELMAAILRDDPPDLGDMRPDFPPHVGEVIARCLQRKPEDRYGSATELASALEVATAQPRGRAGLFSILVPALVVSILIALFGIWQWGEKPIGQADAPIFLVKATSDLGDINGEVLTGFIQLASEQLLDGPVMTTNPATILGRLRMENEGFHLDLDLVRAEVKVKQFSQFYQDPDDLIPALGKAVWEFLKHLGYRQIAKKEDLALWATTSSVQALRFLVLAKKDRAANHIENARIKLVWATEEDADFVLAFVQKAELENVLGQRENALKSAERAYDLRMKPINERQEFTITADYFLTIADFKKAAEIYKKLNNLYPRVGLFHSKLAQCYELEGQPGHALTSYKEAVVLNPMSEVGQGVLMISQVIQQKQSKVLSDLPDLRRKLGDHPHLQWAEVLALMTSGSLSKAKLVVNAMVEKAQRKETVYEYVAKELLAKVLFLEGNLEGAIAEIENYLPFVTDHKDTLIRGRYFLIQLYLLIDQEPQARRHLEQLEKLLAIVPHNITWFKDAGRLALEMNNLACAERIQSKLQSIAAKYPTVFSNAAVDYMAGIRATHLKDWPLAGEKLDEARSKCPDARTLFALAQVFETKGEREMAYNLYREIAKNRKEEIIHRDFPDLWLGALLAMERYFLFKNDQTGADGIKDQLSDFQFSNHVRQRLGQLVSTNL